jgi:hypothetical protein
MDALQGANSADLGGSQAKEIEQAIRTCLTRHNARQESYRRANRATIDARAGLVLGVFKELWRMGYQIRRVENLRQIHCSTARRASR